MRVLVLGSAAGGGYPQWNCNCAQCQEVRARSPATKSRTQSSIAVSVEEGAWLLVNASPDIRHQLTANPLMWPQQGVRHTPIAGVLLTDAQIDHVTGLLMLREGCPLDLYCTASVHEELTQNFPLLPTLSHWNGGFHHVAIPEAMAGTFTIPFLPDVRIEVVPLLSNAPPYSPRRDATQAGDNIGLWFVHETSGNSFFYAPGLAEVTTVIQDYLQRSTVVMVDGTFWQNDEMATVGHGAKRARDMGHMPLAGSGGMIEILEHLSARKILAHINNTNPILNEASPERGLLVEKGIEVAFDGMEVVL